MSQSRSRLGGKLDLAALDLLAGRRLRTIDGGAVDLAEYGVGSDELEHFVFIGELLGIAQQRGYRTGWAAHRYRARFGEWPPRSWASAPALEPSAATLRWLGLSAPVALMQRQAE